MQSELDIMFPIPTGNRNADDMGMPQQFTYCYPDNSYEQSIVDKHSGPGLKRNQLTRYAKREMLLALRIDPKDIETILGQLYGKPEHEFQADHPTVERNTGQT